jgi:hypothetical protein
MSESKKIFCNQTTLKNKILALEALFARKDEEMQEETMTLKHQSSGKYSRLNMKSEIVSGDKSTRGYSTENEQTWTSKFRRNSRVNHLKKFNPFQSMEQSRLHNQLKGTNSTK